MYKANGQTRRWIILLSPIGVIALGYITARVGGQSWGVWSWLPVTIVYLATLAGLIAWVGGREDFRRWLRPSQGHWGWRLLALFGVALYFPLVFLPNFRLLNEAWLIIVWLLMAIINPWLEEGYWRGLLMDAPAGWPGWLVILYSALWFGLSHPLVLGINIPALSGLPGFIGTFVHGLIFALVYWKTRTLRWPVIGHSLADLAGLPILVFLNMAVLPGY